MKKKVLIVGAGGFVGGFLISEGLQRGYDVWAGVRATTSRKYLQQKELNFVKFDFDNPESLDKSLCEAMPDGRWDYIVYNLGATKVNNYGDFSRINYEYLRRFTEALNKSGKMPEKFLYMSSLSAMGPGGERNYTPFDETMIPRPDTRYGASKLKAEIWLQTAGIPYIIFRPTGIYGPRDHDYFLMFKAISRGFDFGVGFRKQMLTFIYVEDLCEAVYLALEKSPVNEIYNISESRGYSQKEFRHIVMGKIDRRLVVPMRLPLWIVKGVSVIAEKWGVAVNKPSTLNSDKYKIMKQRNWNVDVSKARDKFGFEAKTPLSEGVEKSIRWYRKEKWL